MDFVDPYHSVTVIAFVTNPQPFITGSAMKIFSRMGDRLGSSIIANVEPGVLAEPEASRRIARALRLAFSALSDCQCAADRLPYISLYLLERVLEVCNDEQARLDINTTLAELRDLASRMRTGIGSEHGLV